MEGGELLNGIKSWNTDPSESSRSDQLHQLVVAHVAQKVLQTAFAWRGHVKQREVLGLFFFKKKRLFPQRSGAVYLPEQTARVLHHHCPEHQGWAGC